jgi:hypothetical protein
MELVRTTSIRIVHLSSNVLELKSFENRRHVLQLLLRLKARADQSNRRSRPPNNLNSNHDLANEHDENKPRIQFAKQEDDHEDGNEDVEHPGVRTRSSSRGASRSPNAIPDQEALAPTDGNDAASSTSLSMLLMTATTNQSTEMDHQHAGDDNEVENDEKQSWLHHSHSSTDLSNSFFSNATPPPPPPTQLIGNRRRAVSDSLVRFLGLGESHDENASSDPLTTLWTEQTTNISRSRESSPMRTRVEIKDEPQGIARKMDENDDENVPVDKLTLGSIDSSSNNALVNMEHEWNEILQNPDPSLSIVGVESVRLECTLDTFHELFLADDAPYALDWYQREKIHDRDVALTRWKPTENNPERSSFATTNTTRKISRTLTFIHPLPKSSALFSVSEAHSTRHQEFTRYGNAGMILTNRTTVSGIPAADCFAIHDCWTIATAPTTSDEEEDRNAIPTILLSIRFAPVFTKYSLFKSLIEKNIRKESKDWYAAYIAMVQEKLLERREEELVDNNAKIAQPVPVDTTEMAPSLTPQQQQLSCHPLAEKQLKILAEMKLQQQQLRSMYRAMLIGLVLGLLVIVVMIMQLLTMVYTHESLRNEIARLQQRHRPIIFEEMKCVHAQQDQYNTSLDDFRL